LENSVEICFLWRICWENAKWHSECLDNGFTFSDITILCRGNNDIFNYSQLLGNLKVHYNGKETHIKTISEKGLTLDLSFTIKALIEFWNGKSIRKTASFWWKWCTSWMFPEESEWQISPLKSEPFWTWNRSRNRKLYWYSLSYQIGSKWCTATESL
jgi:hypothetical protein